MKKYLLPLLAGVIVAPIVYAYVVVEGDYIEYGTQMLGAPTQGIRYERSIIPEADSKYEIGTSSRAYLRINVDEVCITGDSCQTAWPSASTFEGVLNDISDVATTTTSYGDFLMWNGTAWTNKATSTFGITAAGAFLLADWFSTTTKANLTITKSQVSDFGTYAPVGSYLTYAVASSTYQPKGSYLTSAYATSTYLALSGGTLTGKLTATYASSTGLTSAAIWGTLYGSATDLICTDCINATEIEDIYVLTAGDTMTGKLTLNGASSTPGFTGNVWGNLYGNANTASALAADPADCAAGTVATAIAANGNLTCGITPLVSGGTLTTNYHCRYDGTGIDCDRLEDASGACAANSVCMGGHTHVGVNETYGSGWNADTDTPEKDDIYDYLHLMDTDDDGLVNALDTDAVDNIAEIAAALKDGSGDCSSGLICLGDHTHSAYLSLATYFATTSKLNLNVGSVEGVDFGTLTNGKICVYDEANTEIDCNYTDLAGSGEGLSTSTPIADTYVIYGTGAATVGAEAAFTYDDSTNRLSASYASTTGITATSFWGTLYGSATDLTCTDCLNATEIEDIYLLTSGDSMTGKLTMTYASSTGITSTNFWGSFIGNLTGNANTATALASNPDDCAANTYATTIAANGNLTCSAIAAAGMASADFGSFTCNGTSCSLDNGSVGIAQLASVDFGGFTCNGSTCTIDDAFLKNDGDTGTGGYDFGGADYLEIPNGTGPTCNDPGEICHDTSDNQLIVDDYVIPMNNVKIWSATIASTSQAFIGGGLLKVPTMLDAYTMTAIRCSVQGGTNKVIAIEDESANSTEDITCTASVTSDDGSITNATVTAAEEMYIDFGATSGTVDYVAISVFGTWTRE